MTANQKLKYMLLDKHLIRRIILLVSLLVTSTDLRGQALDFLSDDVTYLWPTDASLQISSTFAETRSAHLHAGLDIRTFGREGFRVFATRDGIVHRVATGPYGYGNVVYLRHDDDSFSVYAHLNRFEPRLQSVVDSLRFIDYSFDINTELEDHQITYSRGDLIAFTGSTGIGPPHLHFELRTPDFEPFNPLLTNIRVQDSLPPVFRQIAIEHKHSATLHPLSYSIHEGTLRRGVYDFGEISVNGPVGLSVNVHDRADSTPNVYAVYSLTMMHESDTLFHARADYFPDNARRQMFLDRSYPILTQTRAGFQRLFMVAGNTLPFYSQVKNNGILFYPGERYPLRIIAKDIFGNRSVARVTLNFRNTGPVDFSATHVPAYPSIPELPDEDFQAFYSTVTGYSLRHPIRSPSAAKAGSRHPTEKHYIPYRISENFTIQRKLSPGKKTTFSSKDNKLWIDFPADALYDTLRLQLELTETDNGIHIQFEPDRLPIQQPVTLRYMLPEPYKNSDRVVLYSVDNIRNRNFYRASTVSDGILTAELREISSLYITEDTQKPWVGNVRVGKDLAGNINVIVPVRDSESGIDHRRSRIIVNGEKGLTGYNPDKNYLFYYKPGFAPNKVNSVEIDVFDGAGNHSERRASFRYTP